MALYKTGMNPKDMSYQKSSQVSVNKKALFGCYLREASFLLMESTGDKRNGTVQI
jgi:hypothetical protein